jgi:hypothetical protein
LFGIELCAAADSAGVKKMPSRSLPPVDRVEAMGRTFQLLVDDRKQRHGRAAPTVALFLSKVGSVDFKFAVFTLRRSALVEFYPDLGRRSVRRWFVFKDAAKSSQRAPPEPVHRGNRERALRSLVDWAGAAARTRFASGTLSPSRRLRAVDPSSLGGSSFAPAAMSKRKISARLRS